MFSGLKYCVNVIFKLYMCVQTYFSVWAGALNILIFKVNFSLNIHVGIMFIKKGVFSLPHGKANIF